MRRTAVATTSRRQQKQPANESQPEVEEEPVQFTAEPAAEDDAEEKEVRPYLDSLRSLSINTGKV